MFPGIATDLKYRPYVTIQIIPIGSRTNITTDRFWRTDIAGASCDGREDKANGQGGHPCYRQDRQGDLGDVLLRGVGVLSGLRGLISAVLQRRLFRLRSGDW